MGIRILEGAYDGGDEVRAVMVDSTTEAAFGPLFESGEHVEDFLAWLEQDPRGFRADQLASLHAEWRKLRVDDDGEIKGVDVSRDGIDYFETQPADLLNDPDHVETALREAGYPEDADAVARMTGPEYDEFVSEEVC